MTHRTDWLSRRLRNGTDNAGGLVGRRRLAGGLLAALAIVLGGCAEDIDTTYGRRAGMFGGESVNGTAVLARMFEDAGHRVRTKRYLTDALMEKSHAIVWIPNDFAPPSQEVTDWFDAWLAQGGRTLIYVGRDFDAGPLYYDKIIPNAPIDQASELRRRRFDARTDYNSGRATVMGTPSCDWFSLDTTVKKRSVTELSGPWSDGVDASQVEIELRGRVQPKAFEPQYYDYGVTYFDDEWQVEVADEDWEKLIAEDDDTSPDFEGDDMEESDEMEDTAVYLDPSDDRVLLATANDILVTRQPYDETTDSQLIIVANGSFLLNLPLINHEHRKLATRLIGEVKDTKNVVFLESSPGGPPIRAEEPSQNAPTGLSFFTKRPLDVILFQLTVLGIIFCLSRWPIFGRPRRPQQADVSDFGKHVEAYGELLAKTGDRDFANERIRLYQQSHHENE